MPIADESRGYLIRQLEMAWKLTSIHLNHWYQNQKAPNPWIGWTDQTGSKLWLHLEFEADKQP